MRTKLDTQENQQRSTKTLMGHRKLALIQNCILTYVFFFAQKLRAPVKSHMCNFFWTEHMFKASSSRYSFSSALECTFSNFSIELFETAKFSGRIAPISCQGQLTKCHLNKCKPIKIMLFLFVGIVISESIQDEDNPQSSGALRANSFLHYTSLPARYFLNGQN